MEVQRSPSRRVDEILFEDMPVGHHEREVCGQFGITLLSRFVYSLRLIDRKVPCLCPLLDLIGAQLLPPAHRSIWLSEHRGDFYRLIRFIVEPVEQRQCNRVRSEKCNC